MNELATEEMESSRIRQEASGCLLQTMHTQRIRALMPTMNSSFPKHKRVVTQYSTDASGAAELHLYYGVWEENPNLSMAPDVTLEKVKTTRVQLDACISLCQPITQTRLADPQILRQLGDRFIALTGQLNGSPRNSGGWGAGIGTSFLVAVTTSGGVSVLRGEAQRRERPLSTVSARGVVPLYSVGTPYRRDHAHATA